MKHFDGNKYQRLYMSGLLIHSNFSELIKSVNVLKKQYSDEDIKLASSLQEWIIELTQNYRIRFKRNRINTHKNFKLEYLFCCDLILDRITFFACDFILALNESF